MLLKPLWLFCLGQLKKPQDLLIYEKVKKRFAQKNKKNENYFSFFWQNLKQLEKNCKNNTFYVFYEIWVFKTIIESGQSFGEFQYLWLISFQEDSSKPIIICS